ncbi:MAG: hypothetical protein KJP26_00005, partial [Maribacter sp.]|nr:hypothetical protein [Maribacter sp.]
MKLYEFLFVSLFVQSNGTKEKKPKTRNFYDTDGIPIPMLRVEQVLLSFGAFVIYSTFYGVKGIIDSLLDYLRLFILIGFASFSRSN